MRFWSKGLGERELVIELDKGNLSREEGKVIMRGVITEPVAWNYEVTLFGEDIRGILRVMMTPQAIIYFLKNITGLFTYFSKLGRMGYKPEEKAAEGAKEEKKVEPAQETKVA